MTFVSSPRTESKACVIHPALKHAPGVSRSPEARLEEAVGLTCAIGLHVVMAEVVSLSVTRPATYLGGGAVERIGSGLEENSVDVVVMNCPVTPVQQRNLEKAWGVKVIDRTGLILEIFGERARTREGQLQVELAHMSYQRSRLVRSWTHLERQRGGFGFMGGPGETQIELDRRLISERIAKLKKELEEVKRTRHLHRLARRRVPYPIVALVGYTNAGKSTLFNRLTNANVYAQDQLFATLDPTMRALRLPSGRSVILSDTVGFVSDLPHELVAAFHATLEEVLEADVVVHVRDIAHPESQAQKEDVEHVLKVELGLEEVVDKGMLEALNKTDLLSKEKKNEVRMQCQRTPLKRALSAMTGEGIEDLLSLIEDRLNKNRVELDITLPISDGEALAWLYRHGEVVERTESEMDICIRVRLDAVDAAQWTVRSGSPRGQG